MKTKLSLLKAHFEAGDLQKALSIAAKFPRLGKEKATIVRGHEAFTNPSFYKQIGKDVEILKLDAEAALIRLFKFSK